MHPVGHITTTTMSSGRQRHAGDVDTTSGAVNVFAMEADDLGDGWSQLTYIHDGFIYYRVFDRHYRPRYLVTLAERFALDVCNETWEEE